MLDFRRRVSESIVINEDFAVQVVGIKGRTVRLRILAPASVLAGKQEAVEPFRPRGAATPAPPPAEPPETDRLIGDLFNNDAAREGAARALGSLFSQSPAVKSLIALLQALRTEQNKALRTELADAIRTLGGNVFLANLREKAETERPREQERSQGGCLTSRETTSIPSGDAPEQPLSVAPTPAREFCKELMDRLRPFFQALPEEPKARLAAVTDLYSAIREQTAEVLQPAVTRLLREAASLNYDQKVDLAHEVNRVLLDARLAILDPDSRLPANLKVHRSRPSSSISTLRVQDSRHADDGRRHTLRADDLIRRGIELVPTNDESAVSSPPRPDIPRSR